MRKALKTLAILTVVCPPGIGVATAGKDSGEVAAACAMSRAQISAWIPKTEDDI